MNVPLLQMTAISKRFPGVVALDRVDFEVSRRGDRGARRRERRGQIDADEDPRRHPSGGLGRVRIDGAPVAMHAPARRRPARHRGHPPGARGHRQAGRRRQRLPRPRAPPRRTAAAARSPPDGCRRPSASWHASASGCRRARRCDRLSTAERQLVAIARALSMDARLLILDEPTSSLTSSDTERLFARAPRSAVRGNGDRLHLASSEGNRDAGRPRVRAPGRPERRDARREAITHDRLVQLMVGRAVERPSARPDRAPRTRPRPCCRSSGCAPAAILRVEVSLAVHRGEVLGIAGLVGAGRSELAEAICGVGVRLAGTRASRRPAAPDRLGARRHPPRHLPRTRGPAPVRVCWRR